MDECDVHPRESGQHVGFGKHGVQPLIGNAIAKENYGIALMQVESLRLCQQSRAEEQTDKQQSKQNGNLYTSSGHDYQKL
jgi:hypothetical protein